MANISKYTPINVKIIQIQNTKELVIKILNNEKKRKVRFEN